MGDEVLVYSALSLFGVKYEGSLVDLGDDSVKEKLVVSLENYLYLFTFIPLKILFG